MSEPEIPDTEAPAPPWRHRDEHRRHFFQRLSDRTPLRTKLITAVLALVIVALSVISVASVYMLHGYVTTQRDPTLRGVFSHINTNGATPGYAAPLQRGTGLIAGVQKPGRQLTWAPAGSYPISGGGSSPGSLPTLPSGTDWASNSTPVLITVPSQSGPDTWRVIAQRIDNYPYIGSAGPTTASSVTVIVAVDLGNVNALTTRLVLFDLIVGGAIVLVLAVVGAAAVRANLRPLNDIELTAGQIAKGHLDHRVPEGDPRTEVGSLGRSLNAMLTQIERAFHAQEESEQAAHESEERMRRFIADASHELRTPLTTIRGFAAHYRMRGGAGGGGPASTAVAAPARKIKTSHLERTRLSPSRPAAPRSGGRPRSGHRLAARPATASPPLAACRRRNSIT